MSPKDETSSSKPRCGLCGNTEDLIRTPCCDNWICDDESEYVPFSYARNSCYRNHTMHTLCGGHHHQGHEGRWQDCAKCRQEQPPEMYVHLATNDYNFVKLENPPKFEPTHCSRCGVVVRLAYDGYSLKGGETFCMACGQSEGGTDRDAFDRMMGHKREDAPPAAYPIGTLAYYGPTNRFASKIAASIIKHPGATPDPLHRWVTQVGDIRDDKSITQQVSAFFRRHHVKNIASLRQIMGCPHEEGKDYPEGGKCPHCPFWHDKDRLTHQSLPAGGMSAAEILVELSEADPKRQPFQALAATEMHRAELIQPLLGALERGIEKPQSIPPGDSMLFSYATYLLAKWREPQAYPFFIRWLSLPKEEAFDLGGDTITDRGSVFLASVCGGDLEPIKQLIVNRQANESCRAQAIEALGILVAWKELPHQTVSDHYLWLAKEGLEHEPCFVWDALANCSADIEAIDVFQEIRRAYKEGLASPSVMDVDELDNVEAGPRGQWLAAFRESHQPISDVAQATSWWACFRDDSHYAFEREAAVQRLKSMTAAEPFRAAPKVGRNDPCPCGSGKKYKKCCGAN